MVQQVVIAIATFKRPLMLAEALHSVADLKCPKGYELTVIVCDNDPEESGKSVFKEAKKNIPFTAEYIVQKERGIVKARNLLLEKAIMSGAKYIAFFDDDETLDSAWIEQLVLTAIKFNVEAVSGKVVYYLPEDAPKWLEERNFYGGGRPKTGRMLKGASTNNVLIDLEFLQENDLKFNLDFNMSGGSDSFLFREVRDCGGKIVSCREAVAFEKVPLSRATEEWILNRAYKNGYTELNRNRKRHGKFNAYLIALGYASWLIVCYFFGSFGYPFVKYSSKVFNRRRVRKIRGMMLAFLGKPYEEYRTIHGS